MDITPGSDAFITLLVAGASLLAVCVPLGRGLRLALRGAAITRRLSGADLERGLRVGPTDRVEPVGLRLLRVLRRALREQHAQGTPSDFVVDASRQYVSHEFEAQMVRPISMYANLLPPIGFIGTTGGLLVLFLSMRAADDALELGALVLALTSSIFALVGFALLEGLKIRLYGRLLDALDAAIAWHRASNARPAAAGEPGPAARGPAGRVQTGLAT